MFGNYLKIAFRNILRDRGHAFINITGLAIGTAACLLLFLWVQDELSYDRYHKKADRIYRVCRQYEWGDKLIRNALTSARLSPALANEFPWIEKVVRFSNAKCMVKLNDKTFFEDVFVADHGVLDIFDFPLIKGRPDTALKEPNSCLISEEMKNKYFGKTNPVGKIITITGWKDCKVTGIFKNIPLNSHFRFHILGSLSSNRPGSSGAWGTSNFWTYILVSKGTHVDIFNETVPQFVDKYRGKEVREKYKMTYFLQPLKDIHLHSKLSGEIEPNRDIGTVYLFSAVALFILILACLNYINLSTARFAKRHKEVGLRKVLGATPVQLAGQFLGESFLSALISLPPAMLLAEIFLPLFNRLTGKELEFHYFNNIYLLIILVVFILFIGLVSGTVPALFIAGFKPTAALRGTLKSGTMVSALRRFLVVFQFAVSIIFIICTMIMYTQLHYMKTRELGLDKEQVVIIHTNRSEEAQLKYETIKYEFMNNTDVLSVSACDFFPGRPRWNNNYWHDGVDAGQYLMIGCIPVDYDFLDTLGINIVEGRGFSKNFTTDESSAFILNKAALKEFGWESAVGKSFNVANWKKGTIIGVVDDFHYNSLHRKIAPVVLYIDPPSFSFLYARISPNNVTQTLEFLKRKWQELVPGQVFRYSFLDEDFDSLYTKETRLMEMLMIVTLLAILIACLGLFGLTAFTTEQRTKEIGIRKVLGASAPAIVLLLSKNFGKWVLISNIIAWPIGWYAMTRWLQNFAYRIEISPWIFIGAGLAAFALTQLVASYKAARAAAANPVETLRYE